jgi:hypothetical protein
MLLLLLLVLGFTNMNLFSRNQLLASDRLRKAQNEAALLLAHVSKHIVEAVGNEQLTGADSVVIATVTANNDNNALSFQADTDGDGAADTWRAYRFRSAAAPRADRYQVRYCQACDNSACATCNNPAWGTTASIVATHITAFTPSKPSNPLTENFVDLRVGTCWDPDEALAHCATPDNPSVAVDRRINLPSLSVN